MNRPAYIIASLETLARVGGKSWKTYAGALKNCPPKCIICLNSGSALEWMKRNPDWAKERLKRFPK